VLGDCREAVAELTDDLQGSAFRRRWVTVVTLLRAVGHVLDNVDGPTSPELRSAIDASWEALKATKPMPAIFWEVIDADRNLVLKQYQFTAVQDINIHAPTLHIGFNTTPHGEVTATAPPATGGYVEVSRRMNGGPFDGQDPRAVALMAVAWLERWLDEIDAAAATAESG